MEPTVGAKNKIEYHAKKMMMMTQILQYQVSHKNRIN